MRVTDENWEKAKRRATYDNMTISNAVAQIVEGYAKGLIDLPKHTVTYSPTRSVEGEVA